MDQNYKNHSRIIPLYHYVTYGLIAACFGGAIVNLVETIGAKGDLYNASLIVALTVALLLVCFYTRYFALKAQDRAIRAEENFRHFILTGKPFDSRLRLSQIIALRFASDAELAPLANRAVNENLSSKAIKQSIAHWRGDYHRV